MEEKEQGKQSEDDMKEKEQVKPSEKPRLDWGGGDPKVIAAILPNAKIPDYMFGQKKINVHPGEIALVLKRGKIVKVSQGGQELASGVLDRIRGWFGASEDLVVMMMDITERTMFFSAGQNKYKIFGEDIAFFLKIMRSYSSRKAITPRVPSEAKDREEIEARQAEMDEDLSLVAYEMKEGKGQEAAIAKIRKNLKNLYGVDFGPAESNTALLSKDRESILLEVKVVINFLEEKADEFFRLLRGKERLYQDELEGMIRDELVSRVFSPRISQYTAEEIRGREGNLQVLQDLQREARDELGGWLLNHGIQLNRLSINAAVSDAEKQSMMEREKVALEEAAVRQHERNKAEAERDYDLLLLRRQRGYELEKAESEGKEEVAKVLRASFLSEKEKEFSSAEIDLKIKEIDLQGKAKEEELKFFGIKRQWDLDMEKLRIESNVRTDEMRALAEEYRKNKGFKAQIKKDEMVLRHQIALDDQAHIERLLDKGIEAKALTGDVLKEALRQETVRKALDEGDMAAQAFAQAEGQRGSKESFKEGVTSHTPISMAGQGNLYVQTGKLLPQYATCPHCQKQLPQDASFCGYCGGVVGQSN